MSGERPALRGASATTRSKPYEHVVHDFSVPVLGGMLRCSKWRCGAAAMPPNRPAPAVESSATSVAAARAIDGAPRHRNRVLVYNALLAAGACGLTDEELLDSTGLSPSTGRPRRIDLVAENVVEDSGLTRKVRSGRDAVVWRVREG